MAETPIHGKNMWSLVEILEERYAHDPMVYVSGNMMMYYVPNDKRRHTSPDVFLVKGIPNTYRDAYFVWVERKGPDVIFEISSASTRKEDTDKKYRLFQDILKVPEYFLFDPYEEYLRPSLQGFRLHKGLYLPIKLVEGRLHSKVLELQMGREGRMLRLYDPATGQRLLTWKERSEVEEAARHQAEAARHQAEAARHQAEAESLQLAEKLRQAEAARQAAEQEQENLRRELEELRRRSKKRS
jgi:Uma2 family endonuclease